MTLKNCLKLLAHYERAMADDFVTGSPPEPLDTNSKNKMQQAYAEMKAHIAMKYPDSLPKKDSKQGK